MILKSKSREKKRTAQQVFHSHVLHNRSSDADLSRSAWRWISHFISVSGITVVNFPKRQAA